jgi:plasmid stabilization system protein ParE
VAYLVELSRRAERDLIHLFERINAAESMMAARWFNGLEAAIYRLESLPRRCPMALESKKAKIRQLPYGKKPHIYRLLYEIDEERRVVTVLTIRHRAMEEATVNELS